MINHKYESAVSNCSSGISFAILDAEKISVKCVEEFVDVVRLNAATSKWCI